MNKVKVETAESDDEVRMEAIAPVELMQPDLRTLFIIGEISQATVAMFAGPFLSLDSKKGPITVKICSVGGEVMSGLAIYDLIASSKNKIITEGYGSVQSIATCIFQAGNIRRLSENCRFMVHSATAMFPYPLSGEDMNLEKQELDHWNDVILGILGKRSKLSKKDYEKILTQDVYFSPKEAQKMGLCDEVIKNKKRW